MVALQALLSAPRIEPVSSSMSTSLPTTLCCEPPIWMPAGFFALMLPPTLAPWSASDPPGSTFTSPVTFAVASSVQVAPPGTTMLWASPANGPSHTVPGPFAAAGAASASTPAATAAAASPGLRPVGLLVDLPIATSPSPRSLIPGHPRPAVFMRTHLENEGWTEASEQRSGPPDMVPNQVTSTLAPRDSANLKSLCTADGRPGFRPAKAATPVRFRSSPYGP